MYIAKVKNNGKDYLQLMEYYSTIENGKSKRKQRAVKCIGFLDKVSDGKADYLKRLRVSFKQGQPLIESLKEYTLQENNKISDKIKIELNRKESYANPKNIGYFVLEKLFNDFDIAQNLRQEKSRSKIEYDLLGLTKLLIYGRVLSPTSKKKTFNQNNDYLFPVTNSDNLSHIYKCLDVLSKKSFSLQNKMDKSIIKNIGRSSAICFYDVTNYSFEIEENDEDVLDIDGNIREEGIRKSGPSKKKTRNPIVQMGLFTDSNNIPISYKIFPGNHIDITTLRPTMKESLEKMGYKKVLIVADGGLNSQQNKAKIIEQENDYIFSKSTKKSDKKAKEWILDNDDYAWNNNKTFKVKSKIMEIEVMDEKGEKHKIKEKIVCYWSKKFYNYELNKNKKFKEYLEAVCDNPDKLKDKEPKINKYIKKQISDKKTGEIINTKTKYFLNNKKLEEDLALLGYYTLTTSKINMSNEEIINKYKGLSKIENSFRIIKSYLNANPVFVRTKEHIDAHFLICFIALSMIRIIQHKILKSENQKTDNWVDWQEGLSAEKIIDALNLFTADELAGGYLRLTKQTENLEKIFKAFNMKFNSAIITISELKQLYFDIKK